MAEVQQQEQGGGKGKHGKVRAKKQSTHIDMTPMVDLAFLLLTFFMLTTTFNKPQAMEINMPVKSDNPENDIKIPESLTWTIILSENDKIFYYNKKFDPTTTVINETNFSKDGIRKVLLENNSRIYEMVNELKKKVENGSLDKEEYKKLSGKIKADSGYKNRAIICLIKTDNRAKYKNVVDILDEMQICNIGKYALVDIDPVELESIDYILKNETQK